MTIIGFVETSSYLTGIREKNIWTCQMHFLNRGSADHVEFNWEKVLQREETAGDVLGFFHAHPQVLTLPSHRDVKTMRAWCDCLGKPLLCIIGIPHHDDTEIYGYLFRDFRSRGRKVDLISYAIEQMIFKE